MTECQCTGPKDGERFFFCQRHGIRKTKEWHQLCKTRENYFAAWEDGGGPGREVTNAQPIQKQQGPGTELVKMLASIGVTAKTGCHCDDKARLMDRWGVGGCERRFDEIVCWMQEASEKWGWREKLLAAIQLAVRDPVLAVMLNPLDPFPGLIREAIERARNRLTSTSESEKIGR